MGLRCAGSHLLHAVASGGGREMPTNGHNWCPEPTGGTHQSAILPELLWHRPRVSVLCGPSPGSWPDGSFVDTTLIELLSYGLLHQDHGQYLCGWGDSRVIGHLGRPPLRPWIHCLLLLQRTCRQLLASAGATSHGFHHQCPLPLVSIRRDLRRLNSRRLLLEGRKRCKQHLIDNRCSHLNALPPNRAPPPVPARITETQLEKLEAPGVGPHPEGLRIGKEGADPPPEDLGSADGLIPLTA